MSVDPSFPSLQQTVGHQSHSPWLRLTYKVKRCKYINISLSLPNLLPRKLCLLKYTFYFIDLSQLPRWQAWPWKLKVTGCISMYGSNWTVISNYLQIDTDNLFNHKLPSPKSTAGSLQLADYKAALNLVISQSKPLNFLKWWQAGEWKNISSMETDDIRNHAQLFFCKKILSAAIHWPTSLVTSKFGETV